MSKVIEIELTKKQISALKELEKEVQVNSNNGYPGMVVAQVHFHKDGGAHLAVGFFDNLKSKVLNEFLKLLRKI